MNRILITGKNSYIGTSFARYAAEKYPGEFQIDAVGMRDGSWRQKDFSGYDTILHTAGIAHADVGKATEEDKRRYYQINTELALETAGKAKAAGVGQFIFMSSMIVYGRQKYVTEETVPRPENFYGDSKWQADVKIRELAGEGFHVAVLRLPMVYGQGSRGNYPALSRMAKKLPVFPRVKNQRSMLYIENLCEFLCCAARKGCGGIFYPQNSGTVSTSWLAREIADCAGRKLRVTPLLAPFTAIGKCMPGKIGNLCRKAFGSCYYNPAMGETEWDYRVVDWKESVRRTEQGMSDGRTGMHRPLVSITTVAYNSEKTLARTIESVLGQTYDNIEYILIDGLSEDGTLKVAESYRDRFAARGFGYKIISEADEGMYDAINKGIRMSKGEIIGNINSDDWYEPYAVEKAAGFMEETGSDFIYADLRMVKADGSAFIKRARQTRLATSRGWNHPTQFAKREVYACFPYKQESLHDDFDLFLKVRKSEFRMGILNEVLADFTLEGISHDRRFASAIARARCRYRIYRNNGYSRWYIVECIGIEAAKLLMG